MEGMISVLKVVCHVTFKVAMKLLSIFWEVFLLFKSEFLTMQTVVRSYIVHVDGLPCI